MIVLPKSGQRKVIDYSYNKFKFLVVKYFAENIYIKHLNILKMLNIQRS